MKKIGWDTEYFEYYITFRCICGEELGKDNNDKTNIEVCGMCGRSYEVNTKFDVNINQLRKTTHKKQETKE